MRVKAEVVNGFAEISVRVKPRTDEVDALPFEPGYRQLEWADVQALASAESVELIRGTRPDRHAHAARRRHRAAADRPGLKARRRAGLRRPARP